MKNRIRAKYDLLGNKIMPPGRIEAFNVWDPVRDRSQISDYPWGSVDKNIVEQILYHYTNENDLIIDIMAARGTTNTICDSMNRRCLMYDIDPQTNNIIQQDALQPFSNGFKEADLIYWDPPYYNMMAKRLGYKPFENVDVFYDFIRKVATNCFVSMKEGSKLAFVMCDYNFVRDKQPLIEDCFNILREIGFKWFISINANLIPKQTSNTGAQIAMVRKKKQGLIGRRRVVYIFEK